MNDTARLPRRTTAVPPRPSVDLAAALAVGALAIGALPAPAPAQQETARAATEDARGITEGPSVEGITEYRLDNGLRVLLFPDPSKQQITVNVTVLVGSRHEGYGETGMAHLLEHMVFKGTPDHPDIPQEFSDRGAQWNGTTWFDRTNYFETFPAGEENLAWALELEADRLVNSRVAQEDLDSEMTVVRNEWEAGENSPYGVLLKRTMSAAFQWHNYGNSTIGARADIENVPIERLQAFYRKYYQPDNALLVVAGRFDEGRALELIGDTFGAIPRPERTGADRLYATYTAEPTQDGERSVSLRRVGDTRMAMAIYHVPSGAHADYPAVDILTHVLGNEPSGRLYRALVETGMAASVGTFDRQLREPGALLAYAEVRLDGDVEAARDEMIRVLESVAAEPPTEEEVERARNELLKNIELSWRQSRSIALQLSEWGAMGDWRLFFLHRDRLKEVTPEDVRRVADAYLIASNRTVGLFHPVEELPRRAEIPPPPEVERLVADYTGGEAVAEGEAFDPAPANVEGRTERAALSSGFGVALLPKENRGETVSVRFTLRHGTEEALIGEATAGELAGSMLMRGTRQRTRQELEDELDRLQAQVSVSGSPTQANGSITTTRENLAEVLRLVREMLHEPAFEEREWELLKEERLAQIESQLAEPGPRAFNAFARHTSPWPEDHPRYTPTLEEERARVEAATLEAAKAFHARFYGGGGGNLAIVGDFDPAEIRPIVEETFGSWTAELPFERIAEPYRPVEPTAIAIETPDKTNAYLIGGHPIQMRDDHRDYPAIQLGSYILGQAPLASRLARRVRQQEGLSYGIGGGISAHPIDERGMFQVFAIYAPENAEKVERAIREEVARAVEEGFTEAEVAKAKEGWLERRKVSRSEDGNLAAQLSTQLYLERTMEWEAELERKVSELSPVEVSDAIARYIDPAGLVVVKAGDFAGVAEAESGDGGAR